MATNKPDSLRDLNKIKINSNISINDVTKSTVIGKTRTRSNSTINKTTKQIGGKTMMINNKKTTILSSTNPSKGRPRSSSLGKQNIPNKSKIKVPNTTVSSKNNITNTSKTVTNSTRIANINSSNRSAVNSKLNINSKPKTTSTLTTNSGVKSSISTTIKANDSTNLKTKSSSTLKSKINSTLNTNFVKPRVVSTSNNNNAKPKIPSSSRKVNSTTNSLASSRVKSTSSTNAPKKTKSTTTNNLSKTKSSTAAPTLANNVKPKTSVRTSKVISSRLNSTTNSRLKSSTNSSTNLKSSSTSSTLQRPSNTLKSTSTYSNFRRPSNTLKSTSTSSTLKKPSTTLKPTSTSSTLKKPSTTLKSTSKLSTLKKPSTALKSTSTSSTLKKPSTTLKSTSTSSTLKKPSTTLKSTSTSSTLKKPSTTVKTKSNLSTISTTVSDSKTTNNPTITSRLTTSPTPYSSQNSVCSSSKSSSIIVRRKKPSPYANVKAKVNSFPSKSSSRASSTSSTNTVKPKNSISSETSLLIEKKSSTMIEKTESPSKSNTITTIKKKCLDEPCLIVTSASVKKDEKEKNIINGGLTSLENHKKQTASEDSPVIITSLTNALQNIDKTDDIKLNSITPIETPESVSPIVAPFLITNDSSKPEAISVLPTPVETPKLSAINTSADPSITTKNEILDEYIKNIKYDPTSVKHLDPNTLLAFSDDDEEKDISPSFIVNTKHYDDISESTDDFLDCESSFSETKSSLLSPNSPEMKNNMLSKATSISSLSTISSLSSITHKTSNNSFTSTVSIHTLKSIFDKAAVSTSPARSSPIPTSTPKVKKLNPQTLQFFENPNSVVDSGSSTTTTIKRKPVIAKNSMTSKNSAPAKRLSATKSSSMSSSKPHSTSTSPISSPSLRQTPLMKAVKSRVDSNFDSVCRPHSSSSVRPLSKVSSSSSINSLTKAPLNSTRARTPSITNSLNKTSSSTSISSLGKRPSSSGSLTKSSNARVKTPSLSSSLSKPSSSTGSIAKSSITRAKTSTPSGGLSKSSKTGSSSSKMISSKVGTSSSESISSKVETSSELIASKPVQLSPSIPRRNTRVTSLQPEAKDDLAFSSKLSVSKKEKESKVVVPPPLPSRNNVGGFEKVPPQLPPRNNGEGSKIVPPPLPPRGNKNVVKDGIYNDDDDFDDDDEFQDSKDGTFLLDGELSIEPEVINKEEEISDKYKNEAIPSYTIKKHTLNQGQIYEINEDSFVLNQYVEDPYYYQTKHSNHEEHLGDLIQADLIIDQIKQEVRKKAEENNKLNSEREKKEDLDPSNAKTEEGKENTTESESITEEVETEIINEDEDSLSLGSINVKKLLKKNIGNIIKPKNFTNLIKKKSNIEMNESFESNNGLSDNNSEISGLSDKRDSKGSTSYVFSMFMQSLNGANNLIKKRRNSGNVDDLKITISGPYQDDEIKPYKFDGTKSEADAVSLSVDANSLGSSTKPVVVPLNTTIEIPKRVSSAIPYSDDESISSSVVSGSFKLNKSALNSPIKVDFSSTIQSTPYKLINKSVEKNKHISADSAICLGDSITYSNIKDIINEEWADTLNKQKFGVSNSDIVEESESEMTLVKVNTMSTTTTATSITTSASISGSSPSLISSSKTILNNEILRNLSISQSSITSLPPDVNEEFSEAQAVVQKQLKKINNIIREIASTEKTYVNELGKLLEIYYYPMEQNQVLNITEMNYLYSNIVNIYQFHSEIFYPKLDLVLKEHEKNIQLMNEADALKTPSSIKLINESISIESFFKIVSWPFQFLYKPYYINFKKASDFVAILNNNQKQKYSSENVLIQAEELGFTLNCPIFERGNKKKLKKLKAFLKSCTERMDHNQVDILGYLILPIQRLPRYLLLLEGLAKSAKLLEEATEKLEEFAPKPSVPEQVEEEINEVVRINEKKIEPSSSNPVTNEKKITPNSNPNSNNNNNNNNNNSVSGTNKDKSHGNDNNNTTTLLKRSGAIIEKKDVRNADIKNINKNNNNNNDNSNNKSKNNNNTNDNSTNKSKNNNNINDNSTNKSKNNNNTNDNNNNKSKNINNTKDNSTNKSKNNNNDNNKNKNNKKINKLKENLNESSNKTKKNIEVRKATDRTERTKKSQINVKNMVANIESNNNSKNNNSNNNKVSAKPGIRNNVRTGARLTKNGTMVNSRVNSNLSKTKTTQQGNSIRNSNRNINSNSPAKGNNNNNINRNKSKIGSNTVNLNKGTNGINRTKTNSTVKRNNTKNVKGQVNTNANPTLSNIDNKKKLATDVKKPISKANSNTMTIENKTNNNSMIDPPKEIKKEGKEEIKESKMTNENNTNEFDKSKNEIEKKENDNKNENKKFSINTNSVLNEANIGNINNSGSISTTTANVTTTKTTTTNNNNNNNNITINKTYTIAMAAEDIKNIIELCNKAISS